MLVATALFGASLARPAARQVPTASALPSDLTFVISGGGWGHGHGMGQYGARAMAAAGKTWREIVTHYYSGISLADRGGAEAIRVNLSTGSSTVVGGPEAYTAKWSNGTTVLRSSSTYPYMRVRSTSDGIELDKATSPTGPWSRVTLGSTRIRFYPDGALMPVYSSGKLKYYRGFIEVVRGSSSGRLYTVNQVTMNGYLYGVVPREMPASWPGEALRAQAVAARTYSAYKKEHATNSVYHICGTEMCQVYGGYGYRATPSSSMTVTEHPSTNAAVADTSGMAMTYGGKAIFAEFSSSTGGHTSSGGHPYLAPVSDPWDEVYSPHNRWTAKITVAEIEKRWPALGRLTGIASIKRDGAGPWGGRVTSLTLTGTSQNVTISGSALRLAFPYPSRRDGIRSNLYSIAIFDAVPSGTPAEVVVEPGSTATAVVYMRNTGNRSWRVADSPVHLVTYPSGRSSVFATSDWMSASKVVDITADATDGNAAVGANQVAEFRFPVTAPDSLEPGQYSETFRLLLNGVTHFGSTVTVSIRVGIPAEAHLGANLVPNPSFEGGVGTVPASWRPSVTTSGMWDRSAGIDGMAAVRLLADRRQKRNVAVQINRPGRAGDGFVFSAWNRSTGTTTAGGTIDAVAVVRNTDGTSQVAKLLFPESAHGWLYREATFKTTKAYKHIGIWVSARNQTGAVWFDRVRLARSELINVGFEAHHFYVRDWVLTQVGRRDGIEGRAGYAYSGRRALRLYGRPDGAPIARQRFTRSGPAGTPIRLGGWSRSSGTDPSGGSIAYVAGIRHTDGTSAWHKVEFPRATHGWGYAEEVFKSVKPFKAIDVYAEYRKQKGVAWFDEVTLELGAKVVPLTSNPSFEIGSPLPGDWRFAEGSSGAVVSKGSEKALRLDSAAGISVSARQSIPLAGRAGDRFRLSGWNRAIGTSATGGVIEVLARLRYTDGTHTWFVASFPKAPHDWMYAEQVMEAEKAFTSIEVVTKFYDQTGDAEFDLVDVTRI